MHLKKGNQAKIVTFILYKFGEFIQKKPLKIKDIVFLQSLIAVRSCSKFLIKHLKIYT